MDKDGREEPALADLTEALLGFPHVALGCDRVARQQLDVPAEQLLYGRLPRETKLSPEFAAFLEMPTGLVDATAHRLEHRDEPRQVRVEGSVLGLCLKQPLEPAQTLRNREPTVHRAEGDLSKSPADLPAIAGAASMVCRPGCRIARLREAALAPVE